MKAGRLFVAFLLLTLLATLPLQARVFRRWGAASWSSRALEEAGGKLAYEAAVAINSGSAEASVFGFDQELRAVVRALEEVFGIDITYSGGSLAFAKIIRDERVVRLVVGQMGMAGKTVVFKIEQSEKEYALSLKPPETPQMDFVPAFPGCTPSMFLSDRRTRMSLEILATDAGVSAVQSYYGTVLKDNGWTPLLPAIPDRETSESSPLTVYSKGEHICFVFAALDPGLGETRITLLHKKQRMQ